MSGSKKNRGPVFAPAPTAQTVLAQVASKLRRAGASVPVPVEASAPTVEGSMKSGLSIALCLVETELDNLAAAAPRDNPVHRALFSLPPIKASANTDVIVPEMPAQKTVTNDVEVDAILWLHEVIDTGNAALIAKAKEAARRIKTPAKELENRYREYLARTQPSNLLAALSSFGFADLDARAARSVEIMLRRQEAWARFGQGDAIYADTPAEKFCRKALKGLRAPKGKIFIEAAPVDARFDALPDQRPATLSDCLCELAYWSQLYWLRSAVGSWGDPSEQASARDDYVFRCLARIPPRDTAEAAAVLEWLLKSDRMGFDITSKILSNLIGAPKPYHPNEHGEAQ